MNQVASAPKRRWTAFPWANRAATAHDTLLAKFREGGSPEFHTAEVKSRKHKAGRKGKEDQKLPWSSPVQSKQGKGDRLMMNAVEESRPLEYQEGSQQQHSARHVVEAVCEVRRGNTDAQNFAFRLQEIHRSKPAVYGATLLSFEDLAFWMEQLLEAKYTNDQKQALSRCPWEICSIPLDGQAAKGLKGSRQKQTLVLASLDTTRVHSDSEQVEGLGMFAVSLVDTTEPSPLLPLVICPQKRMRAVSKAYLSDLQKLLEQTLGPAQKDPSTNSSVPEKPAASKDWLPETSKTKTKIKYEAPETLHDDLPEGALCEPTDWLQNLPVCAICLTEIETVQEATQIRNCKHCFHSQCLSDALRRSRQCPVCRDWIGECQGRMPDAQMVVDHAEDLTCAGFECGALVITYTIPAGVQKEYHDHPGAPFNTAQRIAYLPQCHDGNYLLLRLQMAFSRGLTFSIGTSPTTGLEDTVIWSSIPHKLHLYGASPGSFPDPNYFDVCNRELDAFGVPRPTGANRADRSSKIASKKYR